MELYGIQPGPPRWEELGDCPKHGCADIKARKFCGGGGDDDGSVGEGISVRNWLSPEEGGGMGPLCQQYLKIIKGVIGLYISQWWSHKVAIKRCFWLDFKVYQTCSCTTTCVMIASLSRFSLLKCQGFGIYYNEAEIYRSKTLLK